MNSTTISARQNEEQMLRFQFASRHYYNTAESFDILIWIVCFCAWLTLLLPTGGAWDTIALCTSTALDAAAFIFFFQLSKNVKRASALRAHFDSYVLGIPANKYADEDPALLEEWALDAAEKHADDYSIQIAHTGHDTPPGVRDWYEFAHECDGLTAVFSCQKQNCWWTQKVSHTKQVISIIISLLFGAIFCYVAYVAWSEKGIWQILLSAVGILLKVIERFIAKANYRRLSNELAGSVKTLETNLSSAGIGHLQKLIDERRATLSLESNLIHKLKANTLSTRYLKLPWQQ